jgi:hypothetical protein
VAQKKNDQKINEKGKFAFEKFPFHPCPLNCLVSAEGQRSSFVFENKFGEIRLLDRLLGFLVGRNTHV